VTLQAAHGISLRARAIAQSAPRETLGSAERALRVPPRRPASRDRRGTLGLEAGVQAGGACGTARSRSPSERRTRFPPCGGVGGGDHAALQLGNAEHV
jgi:hypothetical protein